MGSKKEMQKQMAVVLSQSLDMLTCSMPDTLAKQIEEMKITLANVDKVLELQKSSPTVFNRHRWSYMERYAKWVQDVGIQAKKLELKKVDDCTGVGLFTRQKVDKGEAVISVPRNVIFTLRHLEKRGPMKNVFNSVGLLKVMKNVSLAIGLIYEALREKNSFWYEYIRFLPSNVDTALYYNVDEFMAIKNTPCFPFAYSIVRAIFRQYCILYATVCQANSPFQGTGFTQFTFSYENYRWAISIVMSRLNDIDISYPRDPAHGSGQGDVKYPALIPHWDMVNHDDRAPLCTEYDPRSEAAVLFAGDRFEKGQQIFSYYGNRSIVQSLVNGGVVSAHNPNFKIDVKLGIPKSGHSYDMQRLAMESRHLSTNDAYALYKNPRVHLEQSALQFALIFVADEEKLISLNSSVDATMPVDDEWINKAQEYLTTRLKLMASVRRRSLDDALAKSVRPTILQYLTLEEQLCLDGAEAVERATWPSTI